MNDNGKQPWHRLPNEGSFAHEMLMTYIAIGANRTIAKTAEMVGRKPELCATLSAKFKWAARALAYDEWMLKIQEEAVKNQLQKDGIVFAKHRSEFREREYTLAQKLMDQADEMLATPLFQEIVTKTEIIKTLAHPEGEEIVTQIVRNPAKWNRRDALAFVKVSVEIMRLHLEMETSRVMNLTKNTDDKGVRLQMARASLEKWRGDVDKLVDEEMVRNPALDRSLVTIAILEKLPEWAARDWNLEPDQIPLLTEGDDALPLSLGDIG